MSSSSLPASPADGERLHGLDALRGLALLLGLVVHASMAFMPGAKAFWIAHDPDPSAWIGLGFYIPHMFRMVLFFLLAGFFGRLACERLGTGGFIRDRGRRVTLVLLAGWPLVMTGIVSALALGAMLDNGGTLPPSPPPPPLTPETFPLTHLWFLYVLTLCYAVLLALRAVIGRLPFSPVLLRWGDAVTHVLASRAGPALLALPLAIALATTAKWYAFFGIPTPDQSLYPPLAACVAFGSAFLFGWWLHRGRDLLPGLARHWRTQLVIAAACTLFCLALLGGQVVLVPAAREPRTWLYAALYALGAWSWTFGLTGAALRAFAQAHPFRRYLADASYWIYLAHIPVVMALQVLIVRVPGPAGLKFIAVLLIALALLLGSYGLFVRTTRLGGWINGRRHPRRWS